VSNSGSTQYRAEGSGPLLIYVAGLDGTGQLFFKQSPRLTSYYRVITFRSRDHGKFTYDDLTGDIAGIIRDLGEEKAIIVGESFGGTVALSFALRYPQMVERLVVVNSFPRFRKRLTISLGIKLSSGMFSVLWPLRRAANRLGLAIDGVSSGDRERFWTAIRTVSPEAYRQRLRLIGELDLDSRLHEIRVPTLFIAGDRDLLVPSVKEARIMAARIPTAKVKIVEGAGHACLLGNLVRLDELLFESSDSVVVRNAT
jgi:pimeloyl-ACP methyl ester carboxylesterase